MATIPASLDSGGGLMGRVAVALSCTQQEQAELERLSQSRGGQSRVAVRARIVLACLGGQRNDAVAVQTGQRANTVGRWRKRFAEQGLAGLDDKPRPGKPPKYGGAQLLGRILAQMELPPPPGTSAWDGGALAQALAVSNHAVWRVLRKQGIQLQRHRCWHVSTGPELAAKAVDVIGLYLHPPHRVLALGVDAKPSLHALQRARGYVQTSNSKVVEAMKNSHKRSGLVDLSAALEIAAGAIDGPAAQSRKRVDFASFITELLADQPAERVVHLIVDGAGRRESDDDWLLAHPQVMLHCMPRGTDWLALLGVWLDVFQGSSPRKADCAGGDRLMRAIQAFCAAHQEKAEAFVWRKRDPRRRNNLVDLSA